MLIALHLLNPCMSNGAMIQGTFFFKAGPPSLRDRKETGRQKQITEVFETISYADPNRPPLSTQEMVAE